jgi:hypothetical protein
MQHQNLSPVLTLAEALAQRSDDAAIWQSVDRALADLYGHRLFTVLAFNRSAGVMQRLYSSRPDINPVGGMKRVTQSRWTESVLVRGNGYLGSSAADLASVFSDHALLIRQGLESVKNVSVRLDGEVVGSLNMLNKANYYDNFDFSEALIVAQLIAHRLRKRTDDLGKVLSLQGLESV